MISTSKTVGIAAVSFGFGILMACFLPDPVLIVLEAGVIVTAGFLFSKG